LRCSGRGFINSFLYNRACLEGKYPAALDDNLLAGLWISSPAGILAADNEAAKTRNLNVFPFFQAAFYDLEGSVRDLCGLLFRKTHFLVHPGYDLSFRHGHLNPTYGNQ